MDAQSFDAFVEDLWTCFWTEGLLREFPLDARQRAKWSAPDRLDWLGLGKEQESFYVGYACGEFKDGPLTARPLAIVAPHASRPRLPWAPPHDDEDEDAWLEEIYSFRHFAAFIGLGLVALRVEDAIGALPIVRGPSFRVTLFDDIEGLDPEDDAAAPPCDVDANSSRQEAIVGRFTTSPLHRALLLSFWRQPQSGPLVKGLRRFSTSSSPGVGRR